MKRTGNNRKRWAAALLCIILAVTAAGICGRRAVKLGSSSAATVNGEVIPKQLAYFYARYYQSELYRSMKDSFHEGFWDQEVSDGKTYGEDVKESAMKDLEELVLIRQHAKDYETELSQEDQELTERLAREFLEKNSGEDLEACYADYDTVQEFLELILLESRVYNQVLDRLNIQVTSEQARQKKFSYVFFQSHQKLEGEFLEGEGEEPEEDRDKIRERAEALLEKIQTPAEFEETAREMGYTVDSQIFGEETAIHEPLKEALNRMEEGQMGPVVDTLVGFYVIRLDSKDVKADTERKRRELLEKKRSRSFEAVQQIWMEESSIRENPELWKDFPMEFPREIQMVELPYSQ